MHPYTFSVVVCNHNYGEFIGAALDSCLAQDYPPELFEIVVVDDGSNDGSRGVIESFARESPRVVPVYQKNKGQAAALGAGVAKAKHDFICFLDSDDVFLPEKLRALADRFSLLPPMPEYFFLCHDALVWEQPPAAAARTLFSWIDVRASAGPRRLSEIDGHFQFSTPCGQVVSRKLAENIFRSLPAADWRICADGPIAHAAVLAAGAVHYLDRPLSKYRVHDRNAFVKIEDGRFSTKGDWRKLWPDQLRFLDSYVDALGLKDEALKERRDYVSRKREIVGRASR